MLGNSKLEHLAMRAAIEAPLKANKHAYAATIPWDTIHELRDEMERRGFDWQAMTKERVRLDSERRQRYANRLMSPKEGTP